MLSERHLKLKAISNFFVGLRSAKADVAPASDSSFMDNPPLATPIDVAFALLAAMTSFSVSPTITTLWLLGK